MSKKSRRREKNQFARIISEQGGRCFYCSIELYHSSVVPDAHPQLATKDHVIPQCHGGSSRRENLVAACFKCNNKKDNMSAEEFAKYLEKNYAQRQAA